MNKKANPFRSNKLEEKMAKMEIYSDDDDVNDLDIYMEALDLYTEHLTNPDLKLYKNYIKAYISLSDCSNDALKKQALKLAHSALLAIGKHITLDICQPLLLLIKEELQKEE
jgi:hypothetical protein